MGTKNLVTEQIGAPNLQLLATPRILLELEPLAKKISVVVCGAKMLPVPDMSTPVKLNSHMLWLVAVIPYKPGKVVSPQIVPFLILRASPLPSEIFPCMEFELPNNVKFENVNRKPHWSKPDPAPRQRHAVS